MLRELGVEVVTNTRVSQIDEMGVVMKGPACAQSLAARTVLWAAGVRASVFGEILANAHRRSALAAAASWWTQASRWPGIPISA